ncbi:MAG: signal peptidase I [Nanoarchaeota archaeon]|nr:signal peptidase I [Nanoarchaeota archaeon]
MEIKKFFKKIWNFLWKDESILSWIVSIILAFIIVKFIFFPLLSVCFATKMPLVVVESQSMHHSGGLIKTLTGISTANDFNNWWNKNNDWYVKESITKEEVKNWPLKNGLEIGDIVVVGGWGDFRIGDIIIFEAGTEHPIIHRIVEIKKINNETFYATKGDNNSGQLLSERNIPKNSIIGKALIKIPKFGWVKLGIVKFFEKFR